MDIVLHHAHRGAHHRQRLENRGQGWRQIEDGDTVVILESMKMEIPVEAEDDGTVKEIRCEEGQSVSEGDVLVVIE